MMGLPTPAPLVAAFEARGAGDGVVGEDAAVAPAADAEAIGIGIALLHRLVHAGEQVVDFMVTPVGEDRLLIRACRGRRCRDSSR